MTPRTDPDGLGEVRELFDDDVTVAAAHPAGNRHVLLLVGLTVFVIVVVAIVAVVASPTVVPAVGRLLSGLFPASGL